MMLLSFLFVFVINIVPSNAWAFVYQCVSKAGGIEYRDSPCIHAEQTQSTLPIQYSNETHQYSNEQSHLKPEIASAAAKSNGIPINKQTGNQQAVNKQDEKKAAIAERKAERLRIRTEKAAKLSENKAKRRKERCAKLNEKIERIEEELRAGCKLKRFTRLKTELDHCRNMKQRHCTREV